MRVRAIHDWRGLGAVMVVVVVVVTVIIVSTDGDGMYTRGKLAETKTNSN